MDELHADPTGVFGRVGATLPLGGKRVRVRMLMVRQVKAAQPLLDLLQYRGDGSAGQQFYDAAMARADFHSVAAWLAAWTDPAVSEEQLEDATGDETIALIDMVFEQSGLAWLQRIYTNIAVPSTPSSIEAEDTELLRWYAQPLDAFDHLILRAAGPPTHTAMIDSLDRLTLPELIAVHLFTRKWERDRQADLYEDRAYRTQVESVLAGERPEEARRRVAPLLNLAAELRRPERALRTQQKPLTAEQLRWLRPKGGD